MTYCKTSEHISVGSLLLISLMVIVFATSMVPIVHAVVPTTNVLPSIPGCATQGGFLYDSSLKTAYEPCYDTGNLYTWTGSNLQTQTEYSDSGTLGTSNILGLASDSTNIYAVGRSSDAIYTISKSSPSTVTTLATGLTGEADYPTITPLGGYLYVPDTGYVEKISTSGGAVAHISTGNQMFQVTDDGSSDVVATANVEGAVYEVNPTTNTATERVSGLSCPLGITETSTDVYVVENGYNGSGCSQPGGRVLEYTRSNWSLVASYSFASGSYSDVCPYGVMDFLNYIVVSVQCGNTVNSGTSSTTPQFPDVGVYVFNSSNLSLLTEVQCPVMEQTRGIYQCRPLYTLANDGSSSIFVGFQGSAGIAQISNWQPSNSPAACQNPSIYWGCSGPPPNHPNPAYVYPTIHIDSTKVNGQYATISGHVWYTGGDYNNNIAPPTQMQVLSNYTCRVCPPLPTSWQSALTTPSVTTLNYAWPDTQQGSFPWRTNQTFTFQVPIQTGTNNIITIYANCDDPSQCNTNIVFWETTVVTG